MSMLWSSTAQQHVVASPPLTHTLAATCAGVAHQQVLAAGHTLRVCHSLLWQLLHVLY